jgi:tetratricopeptide (TPR) repeat protein
VVRTSSRAFNLSVLGFHEDADQFLGKVPPEPGLVAEGNALAAKGILNFARNRHEEAIPALEEAIALLRQRQPLGNYFFAVGFLSRAWVALERPERGVTALEEASRQKPRLQWGRAYWMESQLRLAQLYREVGREPEAQVIEDELRRYCAWAEGGFPVLQGLASATDP